jgi:hypothetical protein
MTELLTQRDDEAIVAALLNGKTLRQVRREFNLTELEIDRVLDRIFPLDTAARLRMMRLDCGKLDRLVDEFSRRALAEEGQVSASYAAIAIKALERKHDLTGANSAQRIDLQILSQPAEHVDDHEKIREAIFSLARSGESAVDVLSDGDASDKEPTDRGH